MKSYFLLSVFTLAMLPFGCRHSQNTYFDQLLPADTPQLFAPGIVNTESIELNVVFNNSFTEMFFSRIVDGSFLIHHSELIDGRWTTTSPIDMYPGIDRMTIACDPTLTADGQTMYFLGVDPESYEAGVSRDVLYRIPPDIYKSQKVNGRWQAATKVVQPVSTEHFESYPVAVRDGSLYFQSDRPGGAGGRDTYRAQYQDDRTFASPVGISLNSEANATSSYISPDEDYLIASSPEGFQISLKKNGVWQSPRRIDLSYEKDWIYFCPYMSPDGKYFFFTRRHSSTGKRGWAGVTHGEVYWVSAEVVFGSSMN